MPLCPVFFFLHTKNKEVITMKESKYKSYNDLPLMLSAPEVAEVLGISRAGAYDLVRSDGFPHLKLGNRILVPKDKFIQWIDNHTEGTDD
jgi:excisionase family DNA binding protein